MEEELFGVGADDEVSGGGEDDHAGLGVVVLDGIDFAETLEQGGELVGVDLAEITRAEVEVRGAQVGREIDRGDGEHA